MHPLVRSLFRELQDLPPDAREKLFTDRGIDREIRAEVESLLRFDSPRDHAFTEGVAEIVEDAIRLAAPGRASADGGRAGRLPETVGPYRIHREIGRGGMGRVFLAEQEEADFRRTVALKIIDRPGASEHTIRSFRDEVRILASLEHDRIARFFDGGRTPDGTWFLALEYVDGEDLLTYVRGHRLDARARVELFLQVVDAVDFAHRRLVVHRDLKPGNVLVGADGRAKLLDFGISKILDPETDRVGTRTEMRALTPAYASPEQLRGERATVASDVYSLGVMLYEILAGRRPWAQQDDAAAPGATDPEPPSTAARENTAPGARTDESTTAVRWRSLAGDLDAITLKALRAEPEHRYASAASLADDLRRWLAGEAVEARSGGRRYRFGKFVARHRVALAAAAGVLIALAAGLTVALVQRSHALAAQARAEATVADLHRLTQSMLFEVYDDVRELPNSLRISGKIVMQATQALDRLAATAGDDKWLLADLAAGYERLAALYTSHPAMSRSLNRPKAALDHLERALAIRERLVSRRDATFGDRLALAKTIGDSGQARMNARDVARSAALVDEAIRQLTALERDAPDPAYVRYRLAVVHTRAWLASLRAAELAASGDAHAAAATRLWKEFIAAPVPAALSETEFITVGGRSAAIMMLDAGHVEPALRLTTLGLDALDRRVADGRATWATERARAAVLDPRVTALSRLGRSSEALAACKEMLRVRSAMAYDPDEALPQAINSIGDNQHAALLARDVGDLEFATSALANAERATADAEQRWGADAFASQRVEVDWTRGKVLEARAAQATSGAERHRLLAEGLEAYRSALRRADAMGGPGHVHGIPTDRLEAFRHDKERLEAMLHR